jgi:MinD superfamily P-loop ATPase
MGGPPLLFSDLCHGCGACTLACPAGALDETGREVGLVEWGEVAGWSRLALVRGSLRLGEARAVPVIEAVRAHGTPASLDLLDCPPGTACPFVASVRGVDAVLLVTEPTPFGLSDLEQAVETVRRLGTPCGVVVNRAGSGDDRVATYCRSEGLPILLEIPYSRRIAEAYAHGRPAALADPDLAAALERLHQTLAAGSLRPLPARPAPPPTITHTDLPGAWP